MRPDPSLMLDSARRMVQRSADTTSTATDRFLQRMLALNSEQVAVLRDATTSVGIDPDVAAWAAEELEDTLEDITELQALLDDSVGPDTTSAPYMPD